MLSLNANLECRNKLGNEFEWKMMVIEEFPALIVLLGLER